MSLAWAELTIAGLAAGGVRDLVVCPGSRSAPLAIAAAASPLRVHAVIDERAAGFFALGLGRAGGRPAAVICTSGTAGAHLYPAVIEASMAAVPLIAVTADRPTELHGCGAPQTIEQRGLYADFPRLAIDLGAALATPLGARAAARKIAQAAAAARGPVPGPVHINAPAREPLCDEAPLPEAAPRAIAAPRLAPDPGALDELGDRVARARRIVVAAGPAPLSARRYREALLGACAGARVPVLAESTSQLRLCGGDRGAVVARFAEVIRPAPPAAELEPDLIVEIAAPPIAAGYRRWLAASGVPRVALTAHRLIDPGSDADLAVVGDLGDSIAALAAALETGPEQRRLFDAWAAAGARAAADLDEGLAPGAGQRAVAAAVGALPPSSLLFLGNSLPIRWIDQVSPPDSPDLDVLHQRGASGIDGLVAGAAGAACAADRPVCLLLGDVSLAHDLGGLALAGQSRAPLVICALDNGGGRIFDELPYARRIDPAVLERLFATPPAIDPIAAARACGLAARRVASPSELGAAVAAAAERPGATLVCATVNRKTREAIRP